MPRDVRLREVGDGGVRDRSWPLDTRRQAAQARAEDEAELRDDVPLGSNVIGGRGDWGGQGGQRLAAASA
jgi:hypothetical protein